MLFFIYSHLVVNPLFLPNCLLFTDVLVAGEVVSAMHGLTGQLLVSIEPEEG